MKTEELSKKRKEEIDRKRKLKSDVRRVRKFGTNGRGYLAIGKEETDVIHFVVRNYFVMYHGNEEE